jgi:hypothetical protein
MDENKYNKVRISRDMADPSGIKPPKKNKIKITDGVPTISMRKMPPSSPMQPPTRPGGRRGRKK